MPRKALQGAEATCGSWRGTDDQRHTQAGGVSSRTVRADDTPVALLASVQLACLLRDQQRAGYRARERNGGAREKKVEKISGKDVEGGRWRDGTSDKGGVGTTQKGGGAKNVAPAW